MVGKVVETVNLYFSILFYIIYILYSLIFSIICIIISFNIKLKFYILSLLEM